MATLSGKPGQYWISKSHGSDPIYLSSFSIVKSHSNRLMSGLVLAKLSVSPLAVCSSHCGHEYRQESEQECERGHEHTYVVVDSPIMPFYACTLEHSVSQKSFGIFVCCGFPHLVDNVCALPPQLMEKKVWTSSFELSICSSPSNKLLQSHQWIN